MLSTFVTPNKIEARVPNELTWAIAQTIIETLNLLFISVC